MRRISLVVVLSISLAAVAAAGDVMDRGLCIRGRDLAKTSFTAPNLSFDLYARGTVDVGSLIEGMNLMNGESAESIYAKVNTRRQRLYPDEEIILSITIPEPAKISALAGTSLVKAIYWWNNANAANNYWWAQYTSSIATLFVDDVKYGNYKIYEMRGTNKWYYRYRMGAGYSYGAYNYGSYALRGFEGVATVASIADIVMFFFK
jgi:hypothetical protein